MLEGFQLMVKPVGPQCNLKCTYCFYLDKEKSLLKSQTRFISDATLEVFIREYIRIQDTDEVVFVWQGGEPTIAGLDLFKRAVELQLMYADGKRILNSLQTNGTLLDDEWGSFLARHHFLVGLSLDGPADIHNRFRVDTLGNPTFDRVMLGLDLLRKHDIEFNILACVAHETAKRPLEVYRFFKEQGVEFIQFIPIVERTYDMDPSGPGLRLAPPHTHGERWVEGSSGEVTSWSVIPEAYGDFLIEVFKEWVKEDVGEVIVMNFEWALNAWFLGTSPVCQFARECGRSLVLEWNGDIYSCDHYVFPEYRLGNIMEDDLATILTGPKQTSFGHDKETRLPKQCRECEVLFACRGGCPKNRFAISHQGETGLNYLCAGHRKFFSYAEKYMVKMANLLAAGQPVSQIMDLRRP